MKELNTKQMKDVNGGKSVIVDQIIGTVNDVIEWWNHL